MTKDIYIYFNFQQIASRRADMTHSVFCDATHCIAAKCQIMAAGIPKWSSHGECEKVMLQYYIMMYLFWFLNVCNLVNYKPQCISFNCMNLTACICNIQRMKTWQVKSKEFQRGFPYMARMHFNSFHRNCRKSWCPSRERVSVLPYQWMDGQLTFCYICEYAFFFFCS